MDTVWYIEPADQNCYNVEELNGKFFLSEDAAYDALKEKLLEMFPRASKRYLHDEEKFEELIQEVEDYGLWGSPRAFRKHFKGKYSQLAFVDNYNFYHSWYNNVVKKLELYKNK